MGYTNINFRIEIASGKEEWGGRLMTLQYL